jgi:hypothetical protein
MGLLEWGAFAFGTIIGWYVYYINRYRKGEVGFNDITVLVGAIGGAAVTALFDSSGTQFAAYGIGLAVGFFGYFTTLLLLVRMSKNFNSDWFLDGRRIGPDGTPGYTDADQEPQRPAFTPKPQQDGFHGSNPAQPQALVVPLQLDVQPTITQSGLAPAHLPQAMAQKSKAQRVIDSCKSQRKVDANRKDCNKFASAVAGDFGVSLSGNADAILDQLAKSGSGWTAIGAGKGVEAEQAAADGKLVVAGLSTGDMGDDHGHIVVVVKGALAHNKYPTAYWGTINHTDTQGNETELSKNGGKGVGLNWSFNKTDRDKVRYYSHPIN